MTSLYFSNYDETIFDYNEFFLSFFDHSSLVESNVESEEDAGDTDIEIHRRKGVLKKTTLAGATFAGRSSSSSSVRFL